MEDIKSNASNGKTEQAPKDKMTKAKFTGEADILTRATVGDARIYVARTTRLVRKLSLRHYASHLATAALGANRGMAGRRNSRPSIRDSSRVKTVSF